MGKLKRCQGQYMQTGIIYPVYHKGRTKNNCGRYNPEKDICKFYNHPCYSPGKCVSYITKDAYQAKMKKRREEFLYPKKKQKK